MHQVQLLGEFLGLSNHAFIRRFLRPGTPAPNVVFADRGIPAIRDRGGFRVGAVYLQPRSVNVPLRSHLKCSPTQGSFATEQGFELALEGDASATAHPINQVSHYCTST